MLEEAGRRVVTRVRVIIVLKYNLVHLVHWGAAQVF